MNLEYNKIVEGISIERLNDICMAEREGRCILLPTKQDEIIKQIELVLNIKLYDWQKAYIFHNSDYVMKGRRTGKTLAEMLRSLLSEGDPIHLYKTSPTNDRQATFRRELRYLYYTLSNPSIGLNIRKIYFDKGDLNKGKL